MTTAAIFDLDRTLIAASTTPIFMRHLADAGISADSSVPLIDPLVGAASRALKTVFDVVGESRLLMQPAKLAVRAAAGWPIDGVEEAAHAAAAEIAEAVLPFAKLRIADHREAGDLLVLASTSPLAFTEPLARRLGFDGVIGTAWKHDGDAYTGEIDGVFVWGPDKARAVEEWADEHGVRLDRSTAYSDSYFDAHCSTWSGTRSRSIQTSASPRTAAVKGWPIRHLDKCEGVIKIAGREIQEWTRPFMRPELVAPYADFVFVDDHNIPARARRWSCSTIARTSTRP